MRSPGIDLSTAIWRKSSYSDGGPSNCVEVAEWRKSSYSDGGAGNCIEVADGHPSVVPVRDSKDPGGPALIFSADAWSSFVTALKRGEFPDA